MSRLPSALSRPHPHRSNNIILVITMHGRLRRHPALQGDQGSLTLAAGWPMASPVFDQGRNHTANPGEKRIRARSEQAGIAVK